MTILHQTDVAIVGGGLAGSLAAAALGRHGVSTCLIDVHDNYPNVLRCEKIYGTDQQEFLRRTGFEQPLLAVTTLDHENWIARAGYLLARLPSQQYGASYGTMVNAIRGQIHRDVTTFRSKAIKASTSEDRQFISLSNGETVSSRLLILATGLNLGLREDLGIGRKLISGNHSITFGFDIAPVGGSTFAFPALTYFSERPRDHAAYMTLFPIGASMRANLFVYRSINDPWIAYMRQRPEEALAELFPRLQRITGSVRINDIKMWPADLYQSTDYIVPGVVLIGDAFSNSCPAAGKGLNKVFTDVHRLCNIHLPLWLKTSGMAKEKIAAFYNDPVKMACDKSAIEDAFRIKSISVDRTPYAYVQRWSRFLLYAGKGFAQKTFV